MSRKQFVRRKIRIHLRLAGPLRVAKLGRHPEKLDPIHPEQD